MHLYTIHTYICIYILYIHIYYMCVYTIHTEVLRARKAAQGEGMAMKKEESFGEIVIRVLGLIVITDFFVVIGLYMLVCVCVCACVCVCMCVCVCLS